MRINLDPKDRIALVKGMFSRIAPWYDLLNRVHSLRRDVFWRQAAARRVRPVSTGRFLDLATGTGDMALALAETHPGAQVFGLDFTRPMLDRARVKVRSLGLVSRLFLIHGDAMTLPFPDQTFDAATMAFGLRNIPDREGVLREMLRVLVPGGRALILELSLPGRAVCRRIYSQYLNRIIPRLGGLVSGDRLAFRYLADSIMDFPPPEKVRGLMAEAGFTNVGYMKMTVGAAALTWGQSTYSLSHKCFPKYQIEDASGGRGTVGPPDPHFCGRG